MTTAGTTTRTEPRVCAQTFAGLASLGILVHFVHELFAEGGELPVVQVIVGAVVVGATVALAAAWYRLGRRTRRTLAVVLGLFWALVASEHVVAVLTGGTALDVTGLLTVLGGVTLVVAAYWDHVRPLESAL